MPTLFRFLTVCAMIAAFVYGVMMALVVFVEPRPRDVTVRIPSVRVNPPAETKPAATPGAPWSTGSTP